MKKLTPNNLLIGAHTSAAGGVHHALLQGQEIGATTIQLFTSNQKRWESKPIDPAEKDRWFDTLKSTGIAQVMSHDSYLINLGAPDETILQKSRQAFAEEVKRCVSLEIAFLNFHPGACLKEDREKCLNCIVESLLGVQSLLKNGSTRLLLETTAGQGSSLGYRFEELAHIISNVERDIPVGVCIDTCHIFAAGYDIRTKEAWDMTLKEFDRVVGLKYLYAFHMNDSVKELGSRVDRHAHLGEGKIGLECFSFLMTDPRTKFIPKYLETPEGPVRWKQEIQMLRDYAHKN